MLNSVILHGSFSVCLFCLLVCLLKFLMGTYSEEQFYMSRLLFMPLSCSDSQSESKERELKFIRHLQMPGASLGAQMVKNLPTVQETRV